MKNAIKKRLSLLMAVIFLIGMIPIAALGGDSTSGGSVGGSIAPVSIHLIGDSTVCMYSRTQYPRWGWGQALPGILDENAAVFNWAVSGASSKSFVEGYLKDDGTYSYTELWSSIIDSIQEGDYLFIQFGHNDQKSDVNAQYAPLNDNGYYKYMRQFINETKAKGANPILVTSMERTSSYNSSTGKFEKNTLGGYPAATKSLAAEADIPVVDLQQLSMDYYNTLDYDTVSRLYMNFAAGEWPNYPTGSTDGTHFTYTGATALARLVMNDLKRQEHVLADYLLPEDYTPAGDENYYLNESFDGKQTRGPLAKPFDYNSEARIGNGSYNGTYWETSVISEEGGNNALKFNITAPSNGERNLYLGLKDDQGGNTVISSGAVAIEYNVKFPVYDPAKGNTLAFATLNNDKESAIYRTYIRNTRGGLSVTSAGGTPYATIPYGGEWVTVKNVLSLDSGLCLTYLNGQYITKRILENDAFNLKEIGLSGIPSSTTTYNEAYFDNIKVYNVPDSEIPAVDEDLLDEIINEGYYFDGYYENFESEFQTVTFTSTASGVSNTLVTGGTLLSTGGNYYHSDLTKPDTLNINVSIEEDDAEHGNAIKYELIKPAGGMRGIYYRPQTTLSSDYVVLEYEFKLPNRDSAVGIWFAGTTFQGYITLEGETNSIGRPDNASALNKKTSFKDYFDPSELDGGYLKTNTWYKATYLVDMKHATYDLFINDTLITADAAKRTINVPASTDYVYAMIAPLTIKTNTTSTIYLDNVRTYQATDNHAAKLVKSGLDKLISNGEFSSRLLDNKTFNLPYAGTRGLYPAQNGYGYIIFNGSKYEGYGYGDTLKSLSYSLTGGNASKFSLVDTPRTYTIIDPEKELFVANGSLYNGNISSYADGNTYLRLTDGRPAGYSPDVDITLDVVITKGDASIEASYPLAFKRNLASSEVADIEVGEPTESYSSGTGIAEYKTYIVNNGSGPKTVLAVIAMYDADGTLYKAELKSVNIDEDSGALADASVTLSTEEKANVASVRYYLWLAGTASPIIVNN
jgi:lysophospholipase L1-like esterase